VSEIVERFARVRRDAPDRYLVHVPSAGVSLTADMIWEKHLDQHTRLTALGLGPDDLLLCAAGNRAAILPLWLTCRSMGIAVMPVDAGTTPTEIVTLARRFGGVMAVLPERIARATNLGRTEPYVDDLAIVAIGGAEPNPGLYRGAAALKLTSGSTGLPRATFTTESQLVLDSEHITVAMDIGAQDCQLASIPLSHAYGLGNLVIPSLINGTPFVLRDGFVPHQFLSDVMAFNVRVFPGVPFMFDHVVAHMPSGQWPSALGLLISAGARLEAAGVRRFHEAFGVKIHSFYGTSETGGIAYDDSAEVDAEPTVGRAVPGVRITLRPVEGAPPDGGLVHVAGDAVAAGYVGEQPGAEGFTGDGFLTGDFGRLDVRGHLVLTGRASSFINIAGHKVQPEEIEQVLRTMPGVLDVRVVGAPDARRGQQVVACIVTRGADPGVLAVRQYCASRLAPHKIPRAVVTLDRIPFTERGKTDRARLEAIVRDHLGQDSKTGML
jgi:long-chain acyl-CoA synthetase